MSAGLLLLILVSCASAVRAPRVLFDDAHQNYHTSTGRYAPFVKLITADGFTVTPNTQAFSKDTLRGFDILVIANADGEPAFRDDEIDAVVRWVEEGGSLLLVADHAPFGRAAAPLSERFGVAMLDAHLKDETHSAPSLPGPFFLLFSRENELLAEHPITAGVGRVVTFGGQALRITGQATPILRLSPDARIVRDRTKPGVSEPAPEGAVAAAAVTRGRGRVIVFGEAAALSEQVIRVNDQDLLIGMNHPGIDNARLTRNMMRWLARR